MSMAKVKAEGVPYLGPALDSKLLAQQHSGQAALYDPHVVARVKCGILVGLHTACSDDKGDPEGVDKRKTALFECSTKPLGVSQVLARNGDISSAKRIKVDLLCFTQLAQERDRLVHPERGT